MTYGKTRKGAISLVQALSLARDPIA